MWTALLMVLVAGVVIGTRIQDRQWSVLNRLPVWYDQLYCCSITWTEILFDYYT